MRPNILMIHTDQQRFDTIKANGNSIIHTPNLDRLAEMGTNFSTCICQNPVCMPSRVSLLTGQYCCQLGLNRMACTVPQNTPTIQKLLKRYGYETALFGKLHFLPHSNRDHSIPHPAYDFDRMLISDEPGCYEDDYRAWVAVQKSDALHNHPDTISLRLPPAAKMYNDLMGRKDHIDHPQWTTPMRPRYFPDDEGLTHSAFVGKNTVEFLKEPHPKPFFCFSGFYSPHEPLSAPQKYFDLYDLENMPLPHYTEEYLKKSEQTPGFSRRELQETVRGYYAMISEVDHYVGEILDTLEENHMMENTIIVFTSDHGEFLGEYLRFYKGYPAPDVVSRVPLIFYVPAGLGGLAGKNVEDVVESVDVVPTLLKLLHIPIYPDLHGDVLPVAEGLELTGDGLGYTEDGRSFKTLRSKDYRYLVDAQGHEEFYDLRTDPFQYHDRIRDPAYQDRIADHRRMLLQRIICTEYAVPRDYVY